MKITEHIGDITDVTRGLIIHGCNAQGVMASGVAKAIRDKFPTAYQTYIKRYASGLISPLNLGTYHVVPITDELAVVNAITQENYGRDGQRFASYDALHKAFSNLLHKNNWPDNVPRDLHFPLIGCGLGGCDWRIVEQIILVAAEKQSFPGTLNLWILE